MRRARRYILNIPKVKTSFYGSRPVQVKSVKDRNNIIDKIHFTRKDFMKCSEVIKKKTTYYSVIKTTFITNLDNPNDNYLSDFILNAILANFIK